MSEEVAQKTGLKHINVSELVKQKGIGEKPKDAEDDTLDVDEDRLLDVLEVSFYNISANNLSSSTYYE